MHTLYAAGLVHRVGCASLHLRTTPYSTLRFVIERCAEDAETDGSETKAIRSESHASVGRALAALSVEHRAVVELTYYRRKSGVVVATSRSF
jgi:hypothetical protein